jgi:hypothetical protein
MHLTVTHNIIFARGNRAHERNSKIKPTMGHEWWILAEIFSSMGQQLFLPLQIQTQTQSEQKTQTDLAEQRSEEQGHELLTVADGEVTVGSASVAAVRSSGALSHPKFSILDCA